MDRRLSAGGDSSRTPMAWRHRDQLYSQQQHQQGYHHGEVYSTGHGAYGGRGLGCRGGAPSRLPRPASPPETSNSSSLSSESHAPPHHGPLGPGMSAAGSLSTWDGEPCPALHYGPGMPPPGVLMLPAGYAVGVHGLPQAMLMAPPPLPPPGPPPAILLPPMLRPRPLVFPAIPTTPTPPEPLPVREPKAALSLPPKEMMTPRGSIRCCRGGCVVLWIIVGLILSGALLATALRFVVP